MVRKINKRFSPPDIAIRSLSDKEHVGLVRFELTEQSALYEYDEI